MSVDAPTIYITLAGTSTATTDRQVKPELNVWRELKFSNGSGFRFLKSAQLPMMFNPVGLAMLIPGLPIPGLLGNRELSR